MYNARVDTRSSQELVPFFFPVFLFLFDSRTQSTERNLEMIVTALDMYQQVQQHRGQRAPNRMRVPSTVRA